MKLLKLVLLLFSYSLLFGYGFSSSTKEALRVSAIKSKQNILVQINIINGYGVQKEANNYVKLYRLRPGHKSIKNLKLKLRKYGELVKTNKKLSGYTAMQDKEYFAFLNSLSFKPKYLKGEYLVEYNLFYCSFTEGYCSVNKNITMVQ